MPKLKPQDCRDTDWINDFRARILGWYDKHARDLPWRYKGGAQPDSYHVWLSEIMLQQTTVGAVIPYFLKFTENWPSVYDLASAESETVMNAWAGLGYYARARNLHKCAKVVANDLGGVFPQDEADLLALPGIGPYTGAAVRAIAFNKPATVVDGNIERIMARIFAVEAALPAVKPYLKELAEQVFEAEVTRPGDFAQALMDIGAGVCIAKTPRCALCPVHDLCAAYKHGNPQDYPKRETKKKTPQKFGYAYWITNDAGEVLLERRPEGGLLGGMLGLPTSDWVEGKEKPPHLEWLEGVALKKHKQIRHVFTHFGLKLDVMTGQYKGLVLDERYFWQSTEAVNAQDFPTVFKKCLD